jgi:PKD repeat protein
MRPRARASAALSAAILTASLIVGVAPVAAATQTLTVDRTLTAGPIDLGGHVYTVSGVISGTIDVSVTAALIQPIRETMSYDDANVRQGRSVDVARTVATNGTGSLTIVWTVGGSLAGSGLTRSATVPCTVGFTSPATCSATSSSIRLVGQVPVPLSPILDLELQASVTATPNGATLQAATLSGGVEIAPHRLALLPGTQSFTVPCNAAAGDTLAVDETEFTNLTHIDSSNGPAISIGAWIPIPIPPFLVDGSFATVPIGSPATASVDYGLIDVASQVSALGIVKPNNVPPAADAGASPYAGAEGSPIQFDGSATSALCGPPTLRWDFSDGGVAFGAKPFHTFTDGGTYSGLLTATDATGLTSSATFSVDVANLPPVVSAGPDTTSPWGRPVAFNGSATAPGSADQATLTYSWDFGDGTPPAAPSASGGASVFHAYTTPGTYTATLTVANEDGQSSSASRAVSVVKRTVTVGYLGDTAGTYDTQGALSASLVDQYGATVNGRSITFLISGGVAGSAATNSSGIASTAYTPLLDASSYATVASFAGDSLYVANTGSGSIAIARKASTTTYTGALSGGPNKTVTLSATLVDATGKSLAGRTVFFVLGSQTKSAVTNASGVATTTLKLAQKNGKYPLTTTWTPAAADAVRYTGSTASSTFSLQSR